jgi:phosphoribosyl-ATP pyrophosphohydrolase/phosphoribosyl-AMP cyclohydrolase
MLKINFNKSDGLVPVIIQEESTSEVLMLGYMDSAALKKTRREGFVYFLSRSRKKLWMKGEESGNKLKVKKILRDCDRDALLIQVELIGNAVCHQGRRSCFYDLITYKSDRLHRL